MTSIFPVLLLAGVVCMVISQETTGKRECGEPPKYDKAKIKDPSDEPYQLGSAVTYLCDQGYITGGGARKQSTCTEDSETKMPVWTKVEIVCSPKSCGDPGFVMNAQKIGSRFTFPNNVTYKCDAGYKLSGFPRRFCLASGTWSGTVPTCNPITCQRPRNPGNGVALYDSLEYDSVLTYQCDIGFQLSSNVRRICGSDEIWTGEEPFCKEVECENPDKPEYGTVELVGGKARVGSIAIFKCDKGRNLIGSGTARCLKTGEWSFPAPQCVEPCIIPDILNGQLGVYEDVYRQRSRKWVLEFKQVHTNTAINEGNELMLKCDSNYMPKGHPGRQELQIKCLSGELSPHPECVTTDCLEDPPTTDNARVRRPIYRYHGRKLTYDCNEHFKKTKSGNVKCEYGSWVGNPPDCEDTRCYKQSLNYTGLIEVEFTFLLNRNSFTPTCQAGYRISRKRNVDIYCQEGKWTGNIPPCTAATCSIQDLMQYAGIRLRNHGNLNHNEWIQPECAEGFELKNKDDPKIYCNEGEWEGNLPPCFSTHCNTSDLLKHKGINFEGHSILEDGGSIEPKCAEGFELQNKDNPSIYCHRGEWTGNLPPCHSKSCDDPPPSIPNGEPQISSRKHGQTIWYKCHRNFGNTKKGNVTCDSGSWIGVAPVCGDTRCHKESLNHPGLINSPRDPLHDGQSFVPRCDTGFHVTLNNDQKIYCTAGKWTGNIPPCTADGCRTEELSNFKGLVLNDNRTNLYEGDWIHPTCSEGFELNKKNNDSLIYCLESDWSGNLPPCSPAMCLNDPPVLPNGRLISIHRGHGGIAEYECFEFYEKSAEHKVVCSYGHWTGTSPCIDTRCYFKDLSQYEGLDLTLNLSVHSEGKVDIPCIKGYRSRFSQFYCERGKWKKMSNEHVSCEEDDCKVEPIKHGVVLKETTEYRIDFFFIKLGKRTSLKMATVDSYESSGAVLFVKCNRGEYDYYFQITCRRGEWTPPSICENRSSSSVTGAREVSEGTIKTSSIDDITKYSTEYSQAFTEATENGNLKTSPPDKLVKSTDTTSVCSCTYITQDSILIGYDGNKKLGYNDAVKSGSTVTFHCNYPGLFILRGKQNVTCPPGCYWHSTSYPSCLLREGNDIIINVRADPAENLAVLAGGIYTVISGTRLNVECQTYGGYITQLHWEVPENDVYAIEVGCVDELGDCYQRAERRDCENYRDWMKQHCRRTCGFCNSNHPFISRYSFDRVSSIINGEYTCTDIYRHSYNNFKHSVIIEVKDIQCPPIVQTENMHVSYEASRNVNTKAYFRCREPYTKYGPYNVTCEPSGQWSAPAAICKYIQCPEIVSEKSLNVTFTDNRNLNSIASFQCSDSYKLYGLSQATCQASGRWSAPTPSCRMPTCSLAAVYDSLPAGIENVVPYIEGINEENVPYGYSINLRCDGRGLALKGNSTAVCNENDKWTVDKNVECVKGCARVQTKRNSRLKISSEKETYEIGDSLTFLCPEGMKLTPDVQRIMCVSIGWTPNIIPDCQ